MNIQVAVLCDAATDDNGKLNLLGAFDTIYTQQLPAIHPQCSIALRVTFFSGDEGKHELKINFVDADGRSIMRNFPPIPVDVGVHRSEAQAAAGHSLAARDLERRRQHFGWSRHP